MKRIILFILIFILAVPIGVYGFADMDEKLEGHWCKDMIDRDFLPYYFPYLAKENFKRLNPNEFANEDEFLLSFASLLKDNGYSNGSVGWKREFTRAKMSKAIGEKLMELDIIEPNDKKLPFTDLGDLSKQEQNIIGALYEVGIIKGQSNTIYNPKANITQAEAIIVLQRIESLLNRTADIPFELLGIVESYSGKEGLGSKIEDENVLITITKSFPTPGYSMGIEKIEKVKGQYKIYINTDSPSRESEQLQVITYKTMTIIIDKKDLGNPPYNFVLGDFLVVV